MFIPGINSCFLHRHTSDDDIWKSFTSAHCNYLRNFVFVTKFVFAKGVFVVKGATKSHWKIFVSATKIDENTTNILNCYFSS